MRTLPGLASSVAIFGCDGFAPVPSPSSRCLRLGYSVNDYFDSFDNDEQASKGFGSTSDYLNSLSKSGGEESVCDELSRSRDTVENGEGDSWGESDSDGGVFDVQKNYFRTLDASGAVDDQPSADAGTAETHYADGSEGSDPDDVDLWDAAAFLNFNIGPASMDATSNVDPWKRASDAQKNFYEPSAEEISSMSYEEIVAFNDARLCPKMLLTQRAIQSFLFLCEEVRDPHSGKWLEDFLELRNLGNYHGTGAFNVTKYPTWDAVLYDIMQQPNEKMIVSAKRRGRGHGGWSKNNPYLRERWVEFEIDIRPASLVHRIMPVMRQLASEFEWHLRAVLAVDERIARSHFDGRTGPRNTESFRSASRAVLTELGGAREDGASPLFDGNFDLLYDLCTQAAAHRLLRDLRSRSGEDDVTFGCFRQFYADHAAEHFDGDQPFGRADGFLDALVNAPAELAMSPEGEPVGWADQAWAAERVVAMRSEIATEWIDVMRTLGDDFAKLEHDLFRVMMGRTMEESGSDILEIKEERTSGELPDTAGAFE